jgi:hypothetical protein
MANNFKLANVAANASVNAVTALINSGLLRIYDGSQPTTADTAVGAQVLLAELGFAGTSFGTAVAGTATAAAITQGTAGTTGTAAWFRALTSGTAAVFDGSVAAGTAVADLVLNTVNIVAAAVVQVSSLVYSQPKSA